MKWRGMCLSKAKILSMLSWSTGWNVRGCCKYRNMYGFKNNWPNSKQFSKVIKPKGITLSHEINLNVSGSCQGITSRRVFLHVSFIFEVLASVSHQREDVKLLVSNCFFCTYFSLQYCDSHGGECGSGQVVLSSESSEMASTLQNKMHPTFNYVIRQWWE